MTNWFYWSTANFIIVKLLEVIAVKDPMIAETTARREAGTTTSTKTPFRTPIAALINGVMVKKAATMAEIVVVIVPRRAQMPDSKFYLQAYKNVKADASLGSVKIFPCLINNLPPLNLFLSAISIPSHLNLSSVFRRHIRSMIPLRRPDLMDPKISAHFHPLAVLSK